jgi:hypothetical protein
MAAAAVTARSFLEAVLSLSITENRSSGLGRATLPAINSSHIGHMDNIGHKMPRLDL